MMDSTIDSSIYDSMYSNSQHFRKLIRVMHAVAADNDFAEEKRQGMAVYRPSEHPSSFEMLVSMVIYGITTDFLVSTEQSCRLCMYMNELVVLVTVSVYKVN